MKTKSYLAVIAGSTIGGFAGILVKWLDIPALPTTFFRVLVPTLVLFVYLKIRRVKIIRGNYKLMSFVSLINAFRLFLYYSAFLLTSASHALVILYLHPIFMTIFSAKFLKEKITKKIIYLISLAFLGTLVIYFNQITSFSVKDFLGMTSMLVSAVLFALTMAIFKNESDNYSEAEMIFWQNGAGAIAIIPFMLFFGFNITIAKASISFLYHGIATGLIIYLFFFYAIKKIKLSKFSILMYWELVAGIIFATVLLQEKLTWNLMLGAVLIVFAGIAIIFEKKEKPPQSETVL